MSIDSHDITERARKNESAILQGLASAGQATVAKHLECSESTVSRMKSEGELRQMAKLLAACGLKVVPQEYRCAKPEIIEAAMVFARAAMNHNDQHTLIWDD